jgi:hypothetical protein
MVIRLQRQGKKPLAFNTTPCDEWHTTIVPMQYHRQLAVKHYLIHGKSIAEAG